MLSLKENVLETLKNGKPDAFVNEWEPFPQVWDPVFFYMNPVAPGNTAVNPLGVTLFWGEEEPGAMPIVNEKTKVCPDVTQWRNYVKFPDLDKIPFDWTQAKADADKCRAAGKFVMVWNVTGLFETSHFLMGFEDTLCNLLMEPEAMHEIIGAIKDFKLKQIQLIIDNLNPDVVMFHDDWGSKYNMFMAPDVWREFYKEPAREIYGYMKKRGVITMHHADSYCQPIAKDMVEIGISTSGKAFCPPTIFSRLRRIQITSFASWAASMPPSSTAGTGPRKRSGPRSPVPAAIIPRAACLFPA